MTQIDLELKSMAKSALREYISSRGAIDWEQRRYEIAKDILSAMFHQPKPYIKRQEDIDFAVKVADILIEKLKKGE